MSEGEREDPSVTCPLGIGIPASNSIQFPSLFSSRNSHYPKAEKTKTKPRTKIQTPSSSSFSSDWVWSHQFERSWGVDTIIQKVWVGQRWQIDWEAGREREKEREGERERKWRIDVEIVERERGFFLSSPQTRRGIKTNHSPDTLSPTPVHLVCFFHPRFSQIPPPSPPLAPLPTSPLLAFSASHLLSIFYLFFVFSFQSLYYLQISQ